MKFHLIATIALVLGVARIGAEVPASAALRLDLPEDVAAPSPRPAPAIGADLTFDEAVHLVLEDANAIEEPTGRAEALLDLGIRLNERNRRQEGRATLRQALQAARAIPPNSFYTIPHPIIRVAQAMAEAGDREGAHDAFRQALRVIRAEDDEHQYQNWTNLLMAQVEAEGRAACVESIAAYGLFRRTNKIDHDPDNHALPLLFRAMSGDFAGALRTLRESPDFQGPKGEESRHSAILGIVGALRIGDEKDAGPVLAEARAFIDGYGKGKPGYHAQDLAVIALVETRLGWFDRAVATTRAIRAEGLFEHQIDHALFQQAVTFVAIAKARARAGDRAGARDSAREAIAVVGKIQQEGHRSHPLSQACVLLAQNGDVPGAIRESAILIPSQRPAPLRAIEAEQREAGDEAGRRATLRLELADAEANLRKAREGRPEANRPEARSDPIVYGTAEVAAIWSRLGDHAAALRAIETLAPGEHRDYALAQLASERASAGDLERARELIGRIGSPRINRKARIGVAFSLPAPQVGPKRPVPPTEP